MPRFLISALVFTTFASSASATTVVVPDDYATIQLAENSSADTIWVRGGFFPDPIVIDRPVLLMEYPALSSYGSPEYPIIGSVSILGSSEWSGGYLLLRGLHIAGKVTLPSAGTRYDHVKFERCRIDSGVLQPGYGNPVIMHLTVTGCTIIGGARLASWSVDATLNSIIGGGLEVMAEGYDYVRGNYVQGPAAVGIISSCDGHNIEGNWVSGVTDGIRVTKSPVVVRYNVVRDCSGHGYVRPDNDPMTAGTFTDNVALRCRGDGFHIASTRFVGRLERNIAGHCGGHGIAVSQASYPWIRSNTVYLNAGSGIALTPEDANDNSGYIRQNIGFGNGSFGLEYPGGSPSLECNDWYGNEAGATSGVPPGTSDLALDPLFCDVDSHNVHLTSASPLASADTCGLVGAMGIGCAGLAAVLDAGPEALGLSISPNPASGSIHFAWQAIGQPGRLEILDVQGRRRWSQALDASTSSARWVGRDESGHAVSPGIFYARIRLGEGEAVTRGFVIR